MVNDKMGNCLVYTGNKPSFDHIKLDLLRYYIFLITRPNSKYGLLRLKTIIVDYYTQLYGKTEKDVMDERYNESFLQSCHQVNDGHKHEDKLFDFVNVEPSLGK